MDIWRKNNDLVNNGFAGSKRKIYPFVIWENLLPDVNGIVYLNCNFGEEYEIHGFGSVCVSRTLTCSCYAEYDSINKRFKITAVYTQNGTPFTQASVFTIMGLAYKI